MSAKQNMKTMMKEIKEMMKKEISSIVAPDSKMVKFSYESFGVMDSHKYRMILIKIFKDMKLSEDAISLIFIMSVLLKQKERIVMELKEWDLKEETWSKEAMKFFQERTVSLTKSTKDNFRAFPVVNIASCFPTRAMVAWMFVMKDSATVDTLMKNTWAAQLNISSDLLEKQKAWEKNFWETVVKKKVQGVLVPAGFVEEFWKTKSEDEYPIVMPNGFMVEDKIDNEILTFIIMIWAGHVEKISEDNVFDKFAMSSMIIDSILAISNMEKTEFVEMYFKDDINLTDEVKRISEKMKDSQLVSYASDCMSVVKAFNRSEISSEEMKTIKDEAIYVGKFLESFRVAATTVPDAHTTVVSNMITAIMQFVGINNFVIAFKNLNDELKDLAKLMTYTDVDKLEMFFLSFTETEKKLMLSSMKEMIMKNKTKMKNLIESQVNFFKIEEEEEEEDQEDHEEEEEEEELQDREVGGHRREDPVGVVEELAPQEDSKKKKKNEKIVMEDLMEESSINYQDPSSDLETIITNLADIFKATNHVPKPTRFTKSEWKKMSKTDKVTALANSIKNL